MRGQVWVVYVVALAVVAIVALAVAASVAGEARTGGIAVAASCVTAIALLARKRNGNGG